MLEIEFAPAHAGSSTATLQLQTAEMGTSVVPLEGLGTAPNGG